MKDDSQLIEAVLRGDQGAFGLLMQRHQDRLFNSLCHFLDSADDAEDVAQEAFIRAFQKLTDFRRESSFYTWLYRIAMNLALTRRSGRSREVRLERSAADELLDKGHQPGEGLLSEERARRVRAALSSLTDEYRAVIVLREIDGCDYEAIAEILQISLGTVRSRLHRAREQLRRKLQ